MIRSTGSNEVRAPSAWFRDLWPGRECGSRLLGERRVDLDSGDLAGRADKLGSNGGVVSGAAAKMQRILTCYDADLVKKIGPQAGLAVIDPTRLVERDQHVVIDMAWIGILGHPILGQVHRALDQPRPRPDKALTRHRRKGVDHARRTHPGRETQFLRIPPANLLD